MAEIILNIPTAYVPRLLEAITTTWPIPQILNPEYNSNPQPNNPSDDPSSWDYDYDFDTSQYINKYNEVLWAKMKIKDFLANTLKRYETRRDMNIAKEAIDIPDNLVS
jgi:hypothetical protein